ncbi:unnamed protein product, partial [Vitis vinifera]|uniref:Uncharacterized protein n=1 Tax=Vitis vinifera TaxID=29760 RepID=D7SRT4_VITVI
MNEWMVGEGASISKANLGSRCIRCQLGGIMIRWMLLLRLTFWLMV